MHSADVGGPGPPGKRAACCPPPPVLPCPVLPGEPVHPAAAPAITTLTKADKIRLDAFLLAGCPALSCDVAPAEVTRRLRSQNQFMPSRPSERAGGTHFSKKRARPAF